MIRFADVIGQEEAKARLRQMVEEDRVPHALLFCGPQGCGKMAMAMAFASYLLCTDHHDGDSCGTCSQCRLLHHWGHPDLRFTYPTIKRPNMQSGYQPVSDDFAREWLQLIGEGPYFDLEQWMEAIGVDNQQAIITGGESDLLVQKMTLRASQGGYKVCIFWLPERLNDKSGNQLLKLIEEPPAKTVFLFVSEAPEQLLETIRSRTQRFDMRRIDTQEIEKALVEQRGIDADSARRVARLANGSWTAALKELKANNENRKFLEYFMSLMRLAYQRNVKELRKWSDTMSGLGREKQKRLLAYFLRMVRESFMSNFHQPDLNFMTTDEQQFTAKFGRFIHEDNVEEFYDRLSLAIRDIGQNANARMVFFELALQTIILLRR